VDGGTANAYAYVNDPINDNDYSGKNWFTNAVSNVVHTFTTAVVNTVTTAANFVVNVAYSITTAVSPKPAPVISYANRVNASNVYRQVTTRSYSQSSPSKTDTYIFARISHIEPTNTVIGGKSGQTLQVYPTTLGRLISWIDPQGTINEVNAKVGEPLSHGMQDQLVCHIEPPALVIGREPNGAPGLGTMFKESWNLDGQRPDVGLPMTIRRGCNPL
jgi:hypothetical protein